MQRQWYVGWNGVIGLRYEGCAAKLARFPEFDKREIWIGLEVIETAYLIDQGRRHELEEQKRKKGAGGGRGKRRG